MSDEITIADVTGFHIAGIHAGLKPAHQPDLALVVSEFDCSAAALFTRNLVRAAPLIVDEQRIRARPHGIRAVVINAKNANAVTGERGLRDARAMVTRVEELLDLPTGSALVMSTGVIGAPLPMEKIARGIEMAAHSISQRREQAIAASEAIMTTDTVAKRAARRIELGGRTVTLAGMAKGSGMIHPDMATMLALVVTDAAVAPGVLRAALVAANEVSFQCISVDGDTSTNDTVLALANGAAGAPRIEHAEGADYERLATAIREICVDLARAVAFDGEGATRHVTIEVSGTADDAAARQLGRVIATSPLVKTALSGGDANWGRVLAAAGRAGVDFDPGAASLRFGELELLRDGAPLGVDEKRAAAILAREAITIALRVGTGPGRATVWTCDLSNGYIAINADYRT